jgi:hypothetical protein
MEPSVANGNAGKRSKHRRHSRHTKNKSRLPYIIKWLKKNPTKLIAFIFIIVLLYVTFLFIKYAREHENNNQNSLLKYIPNPGARTALMISPIECN